MGKRSWMGSAARVNDNGIAVDPAALRSIMDPKHTLHERRDPFRYSMKNPAFAELDEVPVEAIKSAAMKLGERGREDIMGWLASIGATDDAG